ncbi:MAG: multifunctional CCA addition/repair protein [Burkholderiales bacterium]
MKLYQVGGSIRDELLGLPVKDRDWVVVGASPQELLAQGYIPVGKDFPVFLHPHTKEEVALARTERKTAPGYHGFHFHAAPEVSLEQDLMRRDLTINAMARAPNGELIDPYGGQRDLQAKILRHVSPAFAEDPVRILRIARFAARLPNFTIAPETLALMQDMVQAGEVDALVPERVWQEMARGLMEQQPSRMFEVLRACGALARFLPELDCLWGVPQPEQHHPEIDTGVHVMMVIDTTAECGFSLPVRFAALLHDLGKGMTAPEAWPKHHGHERHSEMLVRQVCARWKVPNDSRDLALIVAREHGNIGRVLEMRSSTQLQLLERCDALRKPERFAQLLDACEADFRGRANHEQQPYPHRQSWLNILQTVQNVDAGAVAARYTEKPQAIRSAIHAARVSALDSLRSS